MRKSYPIILSVIAVLTIAILLGIGWHLKKEKEQKIMARIGILPEQVEKELISKLNDISAKQNILFQQLLQSVTSKEAMKKSLGLHIARTPGVVGVGFLRYIENELSELYFEKNQENKITFSETVPDRIFEDYNEGEVKFFPVIDYVPRTGQLLATYFYLINHPSIQQNDVLILVQDFTFILTFLDHLNLTKEEKASIIDSEGYIIADTDRSKIGYRDLPSKPKTKEEALFLSKYATTLTAPIYPDWTLKVIADSRIVSTDKKKRTLKGNTHSTR